MDTIYHDLSCILTASFQFGAAYLLKEPLLAFSGLGSLSGLLLSPDQDWDGIVVFNSNLNKTYIITRRKAVQEHLRRKVFSKVSRRWPPGLRHWWEVYAVIFAHRKLSHRPLIGTFTRLIWIFPCFILTYFFPYQFLAFVVGLVLVDIIHWALDGQP